MPREHLSEDADSFDEFAEQARTRLTRALVGTLGPERTNDAVSGALEYAWENWTTLAGRENPVGAEMFRSDGVMALMPTLGHATLLEPPLELGDPVPILARRGDLLLAHYLLGHNSGGNESNRTRQAVYYRLATTDHQDHWAATLADPFLEYPTIRP